MITIKKERDYNPMIGNGNGTFHGYAFNDCKRIGVVWKLNEGDSFWNELRF